MTRGFDENERETIRKALLEKGKELFGRYGLKKTGIEDITKGVGIAQGTFYLFFPSKEDLFFEIIEKEQEAFRKAGDELIKAEGLTRGSLKKLMTDGLRFAGESELFKVLMDVGEFGKVLRKISPDKLERHINDDMNAFLPILAGIDAKEPITGIRPEIVAGLFRALFAVPLFKKEIGEDIYPEVLELLVNLVVNGLIDA